MSKFVVEYQLAYDHIVRVGVEAENADLACEKARVAFNEGTIWDDAPEMPLLYDDYEEQADNVLEFMVVPGRVGTDAVEQFPAAAACVREYQGRIKAFEAARALVKAYDNGAENGGEIDWEDVDLAHEKAREALNLVRAEGAAEVVPGDLQRPVADAERDSVPVEADKSDTASGSGEAAGPSQREKQLEALATSMLSMLRALLLAR